MLGLPRMERIVLFETKEMFFVSCEEAYSVCNEVRFLRIMSLGFENSDAWHLSSNTCTSFFVHAETFRHTEKILPKTDYVSFTCQERASLFDKYDVE